MLLRGMRDKQIEISKGSLGGSRVLNGINVVYSVCSTCHHCIGSIRVLITGM